jgi:hypothetical protein
MLTVLFCKKALIFCLFCRLRSVEGPKSPMFPKLAQYVYVVQNLLLQELKASICSSAESTGAARGLVGGVPCRVLNVTRGGALVHVDVELHLKADCLPPRPEDLMVLRKVPEPSSKKPQDQESGWFDSQNRLALATKYSCGADDRRPVVALAVKLMSCASLPCLFLRLPV